jgi:hypothetical protein
VDKVHGIDSPVFRRFAAFRDTRRTNTMQHQNSVFHSVLKLIPWGVFDRLVAEHAADHRVRHLTTKAQLVALLYGQLCGAVSLREIEIGLSSHRGRLYHLGGRTVSRSTLADANAKRPVEVFSGLFSALVQQANRGLRRAIGETVHLIDSTGLKLSAEWARFSTDCCGVKLHVVYNPDDDQPIYAAVTTANVNDITPAKVMPVVAGATYVFDLGYTDYGWWAALDQAGCRIVSRLKRNAPLAIVAERPVAADGAILSDRIGHLNRRIGGGKPNPYTAPVREVRVRIDTGKVLRLVTNDLDAPADEIAALYKRRWQIELFFRWVKQTLKIKHFLGTSENAVRIQIMAALIAYILLRMAQATQTAIASPLAFARIVRVNLMHRRPVHALLAPPRPPSATPQLALQLA